MTVPGRFAAVLLAVSSACAPRSTPTPVSDGFGTIVDLSHAYSDDALSWPTGQGFHLEKVAEGLTNEGYYYSSNNFSGSEHGGTHLDAPVHFAEGQWTVEQIPLDRLIGPMVVIDVSAKAATQPDYQITVEDLAAFERANGPIDSASTVVFRTDFSKRWPDAATYLGTSERGESAVAKLHFPGLHPNAATWLAEARMVKAVGIDTASIDSGQSRQFESHRILNARNVPAFENLANLDQLPPRGATLVALPMKIKGGSGAPLRAIAILPR